MKNELDYFHDREDEDVSIWLKRWTLKKQAKGWDDATAINEAALHFSEAAFKWFLMHGINNNTWDAFCQAVLRRYAADEQTLMLHLQHRSQYEHESVQAYADALQLLFLQTGFPVAAQRDLFLKNLKPSLKKRVINTCPTSLDDAVKAALFLEAQDSANSPQKLQALQEQGKTKPKDEIGLREVTEAFRDLKLHLAQHKPQGDRANRQGQRAHNDRGPPITCFKCGSVGHKAADCPNLGAEGPARAQHFARTNYIESRDEAPEYKVPTSCKVPIYNFSNISRRGEYATGAQPMQRTPRNRAPFSPEQMRARARELQDARGGANRGQQGEERGPSRRPFQLPRPPARPTPISRRTSDLDIVAQLGAMPAKLTLGTLLQEAPRCRLDLQRFLESIGGNEGPSSSRPRQARAAPEVPDPDGPMPMETTFESEVAYHSESQAPYHMNSVLKGTVGICGRTFDCIIDTGASDTVLSHTVVRKLNMMDKMAPSNSTFLTAAGKTERPMGMMWRIPVTMGSLTLETDAMVTRANSYNVLIGNDWLQMAGADILLSAGVIRLRIDREQYEDVPIEANTGLPRINMLQEDKTKAREALESTACLTRFLEEHGVDPLEWDDYASRHQEKSEEAATANSTFQGLSSIESLPDLDEDAPDEVSAEADDEIEDAQPAGTEPFDTAWVDIMQRSEPEYSIQKALELPLPSSLLPDGSASSLEEAPEEFPEDPPDGCSSADDSDAVTEEPDDLLFDEALHSENAPGAWTLSAVRADRDSTDWMFDPDLYASYDLMYGPFDVDACADTQGHNSQCSRYWSPADCYSRHSWAGLKVWCDPPFQEIGIILDHAIASYYDDMDKTSVMLVVPDWPDAKWWPNMVESDLWHCVGYYPAGTQLFTAPPVANGKTRRLMAPTKWGVCMVMLGKGWGNGICLPWKPWPPVPTPTIPVVAPQPVDAAAKDRPPINPELDAASHADINQLVDRYSDIFAQGSQTGRTNIVTHAINTEDERPIKQRPHRLSPEETQMQREEVLKMLEAGVIVPSNTSPVVLVNKKDGTKRFCVDYRKLNDVTKKDLYPLPRTEEVLDELGKAQWFSKLDLKSGYWQIVVDPADRQKTAFITRDGLFEFLVMPFGLTAAPATFQRLMDTVLKGLLWKNVMVYLDDIIIYSENWKDHIQALDDVFRRLRAANLKASASKCALGQTEMHYLGHLVTREGILPDASNVQAVMKAAAPKTVRDVRSFLGMANYYSQFVDGFAAIARPLYRLTRKDTPFQWTADCEDAFQALREALVSAPVLRRPDSALPYILQTDWSPIAVGAVLAQIGEDGEEHPVAFASRALRGPELKYAPTEGECFAVVHFIEHFRPYLHGAQFTVQMDHWALKWLMSNEHRNGRLARWALKLQEYNFEVVHRKGALNANADAMSRPPIAQAEAYGSPGDRGEAIAVHSFLRAQSDDSTQHITYEEGGEGSGPSVDAEMVCEICKSPERADVMVLCDNCTEGYHLDCLKPALNSVPEGRWLCDGCLKTASSCGRQIDEPAPTTEPAEGVEVTITEDITEDIPTLHFLKMH